MKIKKIFLYACVAIVFFMAGYLVGKPFPFDSRKDIDAAFERFCSIADATKAYVATHDGELPPDLYRGLVEANCIEAFTDIVFFGGQIPVYHVNDVPLRINKDLVKNPRELLFWLEYRDIGETWMFYLDGTIERKPKYAKSPEGGKRLRDWSGTFHAAGFPYWTTPKRKAEWYRQNKDKLVWDEEKGMYIVGKQPESQPTAPAGTP